MNDVRYTTFNDNAINYIASKHNLRAQFFIGHKLQDDITTIEICDRVNNVGLGIFFDGYTNPRKAFELLREDLPFLTNAAIDTAVEKFTNGAHDSTYIIGWMDGEDLLRFYYTHKTTNNLIGYNIHGDGSIIYEKTYNVNISSEGVPSFYYTRIIENKPDEVHFFSAFVNKNEEFEGLLSFGFTRDDGQKYLQYKPYKPNKPT